jgi:hypothetical protein
MRLPEHALSVRQARSGVAICPNASDAAAEDASDAGAGGASACSAASRRERGGPALRIARNVKESKRILRIATTGMNAQL